MLNLGSLAVETTGPCQYILTGDLNNDCRVNFSDFVLVAANWLVDCLIDPNNSACAFEDKDGDGWGVPADCNDNDLNINPGVDLDGDGWSVCEDCDDTDPNIKPGVDDLDLDGWTACEGDCDEYNINVYPGAVEVCDGEDNDCDGIVDNGDANIMCPPGPNVASTDCISGQCVITTCQSGYYDVDLIYSNGCECQDAGFGHTCLTAINLGDVNNCAATEIIVSGKIPGWHDDWYAVSGTYENSCGGEFTIQFTSNPGNEFRFSVYEACGTGPIGDSDPIWKDPEVHPVEFYLVRVYRVITYTCNIYELRFSYDE